MDEQEATAVATALGGEIWQSGGDIWLVIVRRNDGRLVVLSGDVICEYADDDAFDSGNASTAIMLR